MTDMPGMSDTHGMSDMFADSIDAAAMRRRQGRGANLPWRAGRERRQPVRRASATGLGPDLWELELHPVRALEALAPDIRAVARDAAEPNIFFTLPLLRAAYPRLARMGARAFGPVHFLCLYLTRPGASGADERRLVLFMPLSVPQLGWPGRRAAMAAASEFTPIGTPLVADDVLDEATERVLSLLADPAMTLPPVLALPEARLEGPVAASFARAATSLGLALAVPRQGTRAVHHAGEAPALSRKRLRDHTRQVRRLESAGAVTFHAARGETAVLDAFEAFMVLELASWKGHRGSALYNRKHIAAFSRQAVAALARQGACTIHSVKLDGRTIASLIVLGDERTGLHTWKTAFDAAHHAASPGVQVLLAAMRRIDAERPAGLVTDSLAVEEHPVMDRVFAGRMSVGMQVVGLTTRAGDDVRRVAAAVRRRDRVRACAKALLAKLGR